VGARFAGAAVVVAAAIFVAGCGSSTHSGKATQATATPVAGSVAALLARPGPNVNVIPGTEDFAPGPVRFSFLLVNNQGAVLTRPRVRVWVATSNDAKPFATSAASIEPVGVPGANVDGSDVTHLYVVHFAVPKAGTYSLGFDVPGTKPAQASTTIKVRSQPQAPAVGSQAIASDTPTIASTNGNFRLLTTRTPPDKGLLQYSVAGSLAAHKPFVVVFATPKFCTSRTCGPVVDVVDAVRKQLASTGVRFIHVEVYKNNNPGLGYNQWFKQWHLPTEPWTFLVGADGKIKQRFEGSVSPGELAAAVTQYLT
jgi:hypothetical protein